MTNYRIYLSATDLTGPPKPTGDLSVSVSAALGQVQLQYCTVLCEKRKRTFEEKRAVLFNFDLPPINEQSQAGSPTFPHP
jgi:hypothetical protein